LSTHSVNVIEITEVRAHENAERLEIVPVGGWQAVVKKGQFKPGDRAVYIQPDYTVPTAAPEFSFLAKEGKERHRLKAVRLRGVLSYGLLIPVPDALVGSEVGTDVMADLGVERYEPPVTSAGADDLPADQWPEVYSSKFDVESLQNFPDVLTQGEPVIVTEKIHGANARYLYSKGVFYMGSRTRWLKSDGNHIWRRAADATPSIFRFCESHPGVVLYGEIYGSVQSLKYGAAPGEVRFAAFAAIEQGDWVDLADVFDDPIYPAAPVLYRGPYDPALILPLAEQDSTVPGAPLGHMREGIVIVPEVERRDDAIGRVALKHISARYWESAA
jgi:RNA ligase (TIGR02306 family)